MGLGFSVRVSGFRGTLSVPSTRNPSIWGGSMGVPYVRKLRLMVISGLLIGSRCTGCVEFKVYVGFMQFTGFAGLVGV